MSAGGHSPACLHKGNCSACAHPVSGASKSARYQAFAAHLARIESLTDFTGAITIHFAGGYPNIVEIPGASTRIPIDKGPKKAHP